MWNEKVRGEQFRHLTASFLMTLYRDLRT